MPQATGVEVLQLTSLHKAFLCLVSLLPVMALLGKGYVLYAAKHPAFKRDMERQVERVIYWRQYRMWQKVAKEAVKRG